MLSEHAGGQWQHTAFGTVLTSNHGDRALLKPSYLPHLGQESCSQHTWELRDAPQPPHRTLRGEGRGNGIWVKHQMDPVVFGMTELISLGTARKGWQNTQGTSQNPPQHNMKSTAKLMGNPLMSPKAPHLPGMDPRTIGFLSCKGPPQLSPLQRIQNVENNVTAACPVGTRQLLQWLVSSRRHKGF